MQKVFLFFSILLFTFLPRSAFAHSQTQVVEMTKDGFIPQSITVDVNSTVIFLNKDSQPRWPASNIHPTHGIYPEFDQKREVALGESWTFKFEKAGIWKYHDHLFPHMRGTITVVEEKTSSTNGSQNIFLQVRDRILTLFNTVKKSLKGVLELFGLNYTQKNRIPLPNIQAFKKLSPDAQIKKLTEIAQQNGASQSWNFVKEAFNNEAGSSGNIHDLAHLSGMLLYEEKGFNGIADCSSQFAFGCYHGFLDKVFEKNLDNLSLAEAACSKLAPGTSGPVASCIHGIGHGIASFYQTSDIKKSLSTCRKLISGNEYCFDGVFMEYVRSAPDSFFKKSDPLYPCNELEKNFGYAYSFSCGRNQPSLLMGRFSMGLNEVIGVCLASQSKPFKEACFDALGFSLAATQDPIQIISGCRNIGVNEHVIRCLKAASGELVFQEVPGWFEKSKEVCSASEKAKECQDNADRIINEYGKQIKLNYTPIQKDEDINTYVRDVLKGCYDIGGKGGCYKQVADTLYSQFGLKQTLFVLKQNENYEEVYARCHEVTHYLSREEYKKQKDIASVYAQCDSTCHGGCYHGTMEAYLQEKMENNIAGLAQVFPKICGKPSDYQKPIEFNECLHGMGHAAMFVTDMELKESLALCDVFTKEEQRERCLTGVFMENSSSSTSFDHKSKYTSQNDPFYPCNTLEEKYQAVCWQYQSSYFSIISHQDWKKVADLCLQIPEKYQDKCFRTIGTNQVGFTTSLAIMKQDCDLMPNAHFRDVCVAGVVSSLSYRFVGETEKMIEFCMLAHQDNRESCFKQIGSGILDWDKNKDVTKKECSKIPDLQGKTWCESVI